METKILKSVSEKLNVSPITKEFTLNSFDLTKDSLDSEIEEALGDNHIFDCGEVYSVIGSLIAKQPKGEEGILLNNEYSNLFYTAAFVVRVYWDSSRGDWRVDVWRRDGRRWGQGYRVFSPATEN